MFYYMPTKIYEEKDCVRKHSKELAAFGSKALIVTGRNSARINGSLDDVTGALEAEGVKYAIFDEVEENPSIETVMKARDVGLFEEADFVIGIGGGSPMDAAKAIAFMMKNADRDQGLLYKNTGDDSALPVVTIPTTCGTGSEATPIAVLTRHALKTKKSMSHKVFPDLSLVDGKYLAAAPRKIICDTAIDALSHMWESYLNTTATDYSRIFVREGLRIWSRTLPVLRGEKEGDEEDYRNLMNASTIAGIAITHTGTAIPHALSYKVTYEMGMSHGRAVGRFQAGYMGCAGKEIRREMLSMAGFQSLEEYEELYKNICQCQPIPEAILRDAVDSVASSQDKLDLCPYPLDREKLEKIARWM